MALPISIPSIITLAKVCQYLARTNEIKQTAMKGGTPFAPLSHILYMVRKSVEWAYSRNPEDPTLVQTGNYLYSLLGPYRNQAITIIANANAAAPTITNPTNQTVSEGATASFSVTGTGVAPLAYQWYKNGVLMAGKTSSTLTITNAQDSDEANYSCTLTAANGSVSSTAASLMVTNTLAGFAYWGDTDYRSLLELGVDTVPYNVSVTITPSNPISVNYTSAGANDKWRVVKYPVSQGLKTTYVDDDGGGTIPDVVYDDIITIGSFYYIVSRQANSIDSTNPVVIYS